ncbi:hypothetical protein CDAR_402261 [Caerostris darwini]|uniref:Uncharacterized protein n=1 Tax=Caerostris darwini TaxID=1538125 RepID=A0AAV4NET8_9ARAC|nr:hypothetical protein CDAR_402261 [Caerostris darwini]
MRARNYLPIFSQSLHIGTIVSMLKFNVPRLQTMHTGQFMKLHGYQLTLSRILGQSEWGYLPDHQVARRPSQGGGVLLWFLNNAGFVKGSSEGWKLPKKRAGLHSQD